MDVDLLLALLVLEADLIEIVGRSPLGAPALDATLRCICRQFVGRHLVAVVNPTRNDRPVRITFQKADQNFLADPRDMHGAPVLAGPDLRDPHPAGTVLVALTIAVPVKLDLHPPILIGVDLLARTPDDDCSLTSLDDGLWGKPCWPESGLGIDRLDRNQELIPRATGACIERVADQAVLAAGDQVLAVEVCPGVFLEGESRAHCEAGSVPASPCRELSNLLLLQAHLGNPLARRRLEVRRLGGILEQLEVRPRVALCYVGFRGQRLPRILEIEIGGSHRA